MILEGKNAVLSYRKIMGSTDQNKPKKILSEFYGLSIDKNLFMVLTQWTMPKMK